MNRTKIEWAKNPDGTPGYTRNPITGCLNHVNGLCKGGGFPCYAYKLAQGRLRNIYKANDNIAPVYAEGGEPYHKADKDIARIAPFYPRFWEDRLLQPSKGLSAYLRTKSRGIFVCDMSDLFGIGIPEEWTKRVLEQCKIFSQHRFYLLTKQPQNLPREFPENCWVGVTATNANFAVAACYELQDIEAKVKFLSIEPLLAWVLSSQGAAYPALYQELVDAGINWIIPGACTGTKAEMTELVRKYPALTLMPYGKIWTAQPPIPWLREIVEAADKAGIPVFLKDNLKPLIDANCPAESNLIPNHNRLFRMKHPALCLDCDGEQCHACGVIWKLRQEMPK